MPVSPSLLGEAGARLTQLAQGRVYAYILMDATTRLPLLGDIIRVGAADRPLGFASIGDLLLGVGVAILCWQMTREAKPAGKGKTENRDDAENAFKSCS